MDLSLNLPLPFEDEPVTELPGQEAGTREPVRPPPDSPPAPAPASLTPVAQARSAPVDSTPGDSPPAPAARAPEDLHPALWHAHQLGAGRIVVSASGFAELDAELPGGGWPHRMLTELLLPQPGIGELRLLAPVLGALHRAGREGGADNGRCVMLFDPPAPLCGWGLAQLDLDARQLVVVHGREGAKGATHLRHLLPAADVLWALEQSLRSGHLGAALAWLPARLPADVLRRLQLAAQAHDGPVFLFRDSEARLRPSAAPLRLLLQPAGCDALALRVLKRRGPPLLQALRITLPPVLQPWQHERAQARRARLLRAAAR